MAKNKLLQFGAELEKLEAAKRIDYDKLLIDSGVWIIPCGQPDPKRRGEVEITLERPPKSKYVHGLLMLRVWQMIEQIELDCMTEHDGARPNWERIDGFSLSKAIRRGIRRQRRDGGALTVIIENRVY